MRETVPDARSAPPFRITDDVTVTGSIDPTVLAESLALIVRRQWNLRSAFCREGNRVYQRVIDPSHTPDLEIHDLRGVTARDPLREILRDLYQRPLDVGRGNVFRAGLILLGDDHHRLVISTDHLVRDGRSGVILTGELFTLYAALRVNARVDPDQVLGPLGHQYLDWAEHQWRILDSDYGVALRDYWTTRLDGAPDLVLPEDEPAPQDIGPGFSCHHSLDSSVFARLDALATGDLPTEGKSLSSDILSQIAARPMALLSVLYALLHRMSGQTDLCIVVPTDSRTQEFSRVVGHFAVPLIIRVRIPGKLSFRELFKRVRDAFLEAHAWRRVPLYAAVSPRPGMWRLAFNYQRREPRRRVRDLEIKPTVERHGVDLYMDMDMQFLVIESLDQTKLHLTAKARQTQFRPATLNRFLDDFTQLAGGALRSPDHVVCG